MSTPPSQKLPGRLTYSCVRCANRKVKCDRQRPCGACVKHKVDCVFNISHSPRKKAKRVKVKALTDQLNHYQHLLQEHGIDHEKVVRTQEHQSSSTTRSVQTSDSGLGDAEHRYVNRTQMVDGQVRFRFVENSLWTKVVEESHDAGIISDESDDTSDAGTSEDGVSFLFLNKSSSKRRPRHPPREHLQQLWKAFIENVEPLLKIVHVPTLQPAFRKALENISNVPRNLETLMFSIYSTAVLSLQNHDCEQQFGESRSTLLSRYISATERALSRANFMASTSLVILQALVLHLTSVREICEPRAVWTLTGVAVRIAQLMGLERDGEYLGLPPFETEMRRRIWWQLRLHDFRAAELCGLSKFRDMEIGGETTKYPTSINDDQLYPAMSSLVATTGEISDSVIVNLRCELTSFASKRVAKFREVGKSSSQWNLDAFDRHEEGIEVFIKGLQDTLESRYVRYCDPSQPLHLLTVLIARYAMNTVRFLTKHPRSWSDETPLAARQEVWNICVKLLEQHSMAKSNPMLKRFSWHSAYFHQWHSFIHVLDVLRVNPLHPDSDKVWDLIVSIYSTTPNMISDTNKPIYVAIGNLCLKAYSAREAALRSQGGLVYIPPIPAFISELRQKRDQVRAKRQAREARSCSSSKAKVVEAPVAGYENTSSTTAPDGDTTMQFAESSQPNATWEPDPLSFMSEFQFFDTSPVSDFDIDLDTLLAMDTTMYGDDSTAITWEQWDAWLNESNNMRMSS